MKSYFKILALMLAIIMTLSVFAACDSGSNQTETQGSEKETDGTSGTGETNESGTKESVTEEATEGLAARMDAHIASCALDKSIPHLLKTPQKAVSGTAGSNEINVLAVIDKALTMLYEQDVPQAAKIVANVSPRFYEVFKREYGLRDTNNSELLKTGRATQYGNVLVKMSNGVATSQNGAVDHIMIRTQRAIAFANPHTEVEAYKPEAYFADAVKGYSLYQAKVVRPKELVVIPLTY